MPTHGLARFGQGGTAAGDEQQIGADVIMPAGGPWLITSVWVQAVSLVNAELDPLIGYLHVDSKGGDITPDPAPGKYPLRASLGSGTSAGKSSCPLVLIPVSWEAPGKSVIRLLYGTLVPVADPPVVACGLIFGKGERPAEQPIVFSDMASVRLSADVETLNGTILLSEKATRIVGIYTDLAVIDGAGVTNVHVGSIRLDSDDIDLTPAEFPCQDAWPKVDWFNPMPRGALAQPYIPVDIPVTGGARISCFTTLSAPNLATVQSTIYLGYT